MATLVVLFAGMRAAAEEGVRTPDCIPVAEMRIGGFGFTDNAAKVHQNFKRPTAIREYQGEDDGGYFSFREERFRGIAFTFGRDKSLDGVEVASSRYALSNGVRVGMAIEEVGKRLHFSPPAFAGQPVVLLAPCDALDETTEVVLTFSSDATHTTAGRELTKILIWVTYD